MNNKIVIIFLIFILYTFNVSSVMCGDEVIKNEVPTIVYDYCSIESGTPYQIYTTPVCAGDITIKVSPKVSYTGYYFNEFTKQDNRIWKAKCREGMPIVLMTDKKTTDEFDIVIEYYLQEPLNTDDKTKNEAHNSLYRRTLNFNNIRANYKPEEANINIFDLEEIGNGLYLIIGVVLIIILGLTFAGVYTYKSIFKDDSNEITGEKKFTKTLDMELDDILNDIKK